MNKFALALLLAPLLLCHPAAARAQSSVGVNGCGASPVPSGIGAPQTIDTNTGLLCTNSTSATTTPTAASSTDASGTVTTGGTYQQIIASNTSRKGCLVQNPPTATETLNVRVGATTVFILPIGSSFSCSAGSGVVVSDAIYVTATTSTHAFSANYQ